MLFLSILSWWMMHRSPKAERRTTRAKRVVDEEEEEEGEEEGEWTVDAAGAGEGDVEGASNAVILVSLEKPIFFRSSTVRLFLLLYIAPMVWLGMYLWCP